MSLTRCIKDIGWIPIGKELGGPENRDYRFSSMYRVSKSNKKFRFAKFFITQLFIRNCFHWESEVGWASGQGSGISRGSLKIGNFARVSENRVLRSIPSTPGHPRSNPDLLSPDSGSPSIPVQPGVPIDPGVPIRSPPRGGLNLGGCLGSLNTS